MSHSFQTILFDFDYTLADSSNGIIECVNYALRKLGFAAASDQAIRHTIGLKLHDIIATLVGDVSPSVADKFAQLFIECAEVVMLGSTHLLRGTRSTVISLCGDKRRLGIVTTKFRYRIEAVLERDGLADSFDVVVGAEDVIAHKPDPESLFLAMRLLQSPPENTLYVGDRITDAAAAQRAGIPFVGVKSGVTSIEMFEHYSPRAVLADVSELPQWLKLA